MDYANEAFVKHYTRETEDFAVLSFPARSVELHCYRYCDRSGVIATRRGPLGIALMIRAPIEIVEPAVAELLAEKRLEPHPAGYLIPWWLESQEARQSDKARQRTSRARRRAGTTEETADVTNCDANDSPGHTPSHAVTIDQRDQIREKENPARELAAVAIAEINRLAGTRYQADSSATLKGCKAFARDGVTPEDVRRVIASKWAEWSKSDAMRAQFKPSVLLRPSNFTRYREDLDARPAQGRLAAVMAPTSDHLVLDDGTIVQRRAS